MLNSRASFWKKDPVTSSGYICDFKNLLVKSVSLDDVFAQPEKTLKDNLFLTETKVKQSPSLYKGLWYKCHNIFWYHGDVQVARIISYTCDNIICNIILNRDCSVISSWVHFIKISVQMQNNNVEYLYPESIINLFQKSWVEEVVLS